MLQDLRSAQAASLTGLVDLMKLNDLDRFHLVIDVIQRLPRLGQRGFELKRKLEHPLIEHTQHIRAHGEDLPEIRNWEVAGARGRRLERGQKARRCPRRREPGSALAGTEWPRAHPEQEGLV